MSYTAGSFGDAKLDIVGIVGSRGPDEERGRPTGWTDAGLIARLIARILELKPDATIVSGGAPSGVDYMVRMTCLLLRLCDGKHIEENPISVDCPLPHFYEFKAQWRGPDGKTNRHAGHDRNDKLVRHCSLVLALFGPGERTPGTSDVIRRCHTYNVPVMVYQDGIWT